MIKRILAVLLAVSAAFACCSCSGDKSDGSSSQSGLISQAPAASAEPEFTGKYFDTDIWEAVPMISQELIDAGYENSEACQASSYMTLDPVDGKLGYYCTDIGGIWRTQDGGKSWHPCNIGYKAGGGTGAAIDPNNINRAIMVGANTGYSNTNGLHLTTDGGDTWSAKFMPGQKGYTGSIGIHNDYRIQVAYDESSNDASIGGSAVIYWDRENNTEGNDKNHPAIYKSTDGGETWAELENTSEYAGGYIVVNPKDGRIAVSNEKGAWVSSDGGKSWKKVSNLAINAMVGVRTRPDNLYALTNDGLYVSTDFGGSFSKVTEKFMGGIVKATNLRVSPADPNRMVMLWIGNGSFNYATYYSHDGGKTWAKSAQDKRGIWIPMNSWYANFWFSPVDKDYIIANEYRSEDGGKNFFVSTKGFNAILCGGKFSININDDRYMSLGSQDFNGGFSTDYGKTWTYVNWSGLGWGGYTYGAYCINDKIAVSSDSKSWGQTGELVYTKDGGKTVIRTGHEVKGIRVGYAAVGKENICFMGEWRTDDYCETWTKMDGCTGVLEHDPETGRLFGANGYTVVYSDDDGVTWNKIAVVGNDVSDIAYNSKSKILYVCSGGEISMMDMNNMTTMFKNAGMKVSSVKGLCLDPENPDIMYAVTDGVHRSLDGGKTWTQLCRQPGDGRDNCPDGGHGECISFCASTREIFVAGKCMGVWKMKAAPADATN